MSELNRRRRLQKLVEKFGTLDGFMTLEELRRMREETMPTESPFAEVLEAADRLSLEDQQSVVEILHHRIVERRREEIAREIREAEEEFQAGKTEPRSVQELMEEIFG